MPNSPERLRAISPVLSLLAGGPGPAVRNDPTLLGMTSEGRLACQRPSIHTRVLSSIFDSVGESRELVPRNRLAGTI